MKILKITPILFVALMLVAAIGGCSDKGTTSVTDDMDQSAIEAYKENERKIEQEAMGDMELEK